MDTAILDEMRVYYNYTKKHGSLKDRTPAETSLIEVDGITSGRLLFKTLH